MCPYVRTYMKSIFPDRNLATILPRVRCTSNVCLASIFLASDDVPSIYTRGELASRRVFPRQRGRREGLATGFQADVATCVVVIVVVGSGPGVYSNVVRGGLSRCKTRNTTTRIMLGSLLLSPSLFLSSSLYLRLFDSLLTGLSPRRMRVPNYARPRE